MTLKVIDVSYWQRYLTKRNYKKIKAYGIDAVIARCGYDMNPDSTFAKHISYAKAAGMPVGAYYYGCAKSVEQAKKEAKHAVKLCRGKGLTFPIFYDMEDNATMGKCSDATLNKMAKAFCEIVEDAGFKSGIYASYSWLVSKIGSTGCDTWVAQYNDTCSYKGKKVGWQYSSSKCIPGIRGRLDISNFYKNYADKESTASTTVITKGKKYDGTIGTSKLSYGSSGKQVKLWQSFLNWAVHAGLKVDGKFGIATKRYTIVFQRKAGVDDDGIVGSKTLAVAKRYRR